MAAVTAAALAPRSLAGELLRSKTFVIGLAIIVFWIFCAIVRRLCRADRSLCDPIL